MLQLYTLILIFTYTITANIITMDNDNMITIRGTINSMTSNKFILDTSDKNNNKELFIYINSPGGSVMEGFYMVEHIKFLQEQNITISCIADFAASMAFVLLQFCNNRYAFSSSILMQHSMSLQLKGTLPGVESYMKMLRDINIYFDMYQSERINVSYDDFIKKTTSDWWISGLTAKMDKVIDKIIIAKCHISLHSMNETITKNTMFGEIQLIYSKCPMVKHPLNIIFLFNYTMEQYNSIVKEVNSDMRQVKEIQRFSSLNEEL